MLFRKKIFFLMVGVGFVLGGCSASKPVTEEDQNTDFDFPKEEAIVAPEAQTDAVPAGEVEQPVAVEATNTAAVTPPPEAQPETPPASSAQASYSDYTVQSGDTLMKIAFETYGDLYQWKKIYEDNKDKFSNPNVISPGVVLKLETPATEVAIERNGDKYLIKWGDTLGTISVDIYGTKTKWRKLWDNNKQLVHDPNRIFAGFYLYYMMTPEEREDAEKLKQGHSTPAPLVKNTPPAPAAATAAAPAATPQEPGKEGAPTFSSLLGGEGTSDQARAPASEPAK